MRTASIYEPLPSSIARNGDWILTFSGRQFWPLDPRSDDIQIEDIAHALSMQCRFSGHVRSFYSVAEHSVRVSRIVPPQDALWGLLHDASEAYLVDLPRPLKRYSELGDAYREIEARLMACVRNQFELGPEPESVRVADDVLLMTEKRDLMAPHPAKWRERAAALGDKIVTWTHDIAEVRFLSRFDELAGAK